MKMKVIKNKKSVKWLILLMTISLVGISGIQAYWISNSYIIKEEKFEQQVGEALNGVSLRLETLENVNFLYESLRIEPMFSSRISRSYGLDHDSTLKNSHSSFQMSIKLNGDTIVVINADSSGLLMQKNAVTDSNSPFAAYQPKGIYQQRVQSLDLTFQKLLLHEMRKSQHLYSRISARELDSILYFELLTRGVDVPYEFAVVEKDQVVIHSNGWKPEMEQHKAQLFPNDYFENRLLMVAFPSKANYLFSSMWVTLIISMGFTLAMIYTFWRTLSYSLRQKRINEIKTDFINNMTHEFKTPIATINLAIDAMSNSKVINNPGRIEHYSKVIKQENQRMNMQVESVLRMALMDKNELELHFEETSIQKLIDESIEHIRLPLESRGGYLKKFYNDPGTVLMVDRNHLSNAIINILDNAVKYSLGSPEIKIVTELSNGHILIIISDKGMGMNKEEQKRIFDRFFRVASGNIHNIKGHGLGLSYVQGIIEAHKGRIEVESEKEKGSKFYIYLPVNKNYNDN